MLLIPVSGGAGGLISKICCCSNWQEQSSAIFEPLGWQKDESLRSTPNSAMLTALGPLNSRDQFPPK